MMFHSFEYALFLVGALTVYWALWRLSALRLAFIAVASCLFYMTWNAHYLWLILTPTVIDYGAGLAMSRTDRPGVRKAWVTLSVIANLALLGVFKYYDWFAGSLDLALHKGGFLAADQQLPLLHLILPAGISFYTFEAMSYTIDVYRGKLEAERNFVRFVCFITFFPKLVAGPIVRGAELLPQLRAQPVLTHERVGRGIFLIATGLIKKIVFADTMSLNLVDRVFLDPERFTAVEIIAALYGFTLQIYCDFSGYSDIARGSALLFGLELRENFDRPYQATSPADFWRRWHMTLSTWLRDYLYYPLGGSRVGPARAYFNLWLTFFLIGLWHGASWTFFFYGIVHGTVMVLHRAWRRLRGASETEVPDSGAVRVLKIALVLQLTVFSRILFRATDFSNASDLVQSLLKGGTSTAQIPVWLWAVLLGGLGAHYLPRGWMTTLEQRFCRLWAPVQGGLLLLVFVVLRLIAGQGVVPYIYFQF